MQDDYFRYKEQIYALYADYSREFSERFSMQLGLRMEHTRTTGISEAKDTEDKHDYTRLSLLSICFIRLQTGMR